MTITQAIIAELQRQANVDGTRFEKVSGDFVLFAGRRIDVRLVAGAAMSAARDEIAEKIKALM
jgi:hypothetical protein